jgi:hypothetical protein
VKEALESVRYSRCDNNRIDLKCWIHNGRLVETLMSDKDFSKFERLVSAGSVGSLHRIPFFLLFFARAIH